MRIEQRREYPPRVGVLLLNQPRPEDSDPRRIFPPLLDPHRLLRVGRQPYGLAFVNRSLWVTNSEDGTVSWISPHTNKVVATIRVGRNPYGTAVTSGSLWVANVGDGTVSRISAVSGRVVQKGRGRSGRPGCCRRIYLGEPQQRGRRHATRLTHPVGEPDGIRL